MADKHVKKFMDGNMTPQEVNSKWGFPPDAKCTACGRRPVTVVRVFMPLDELRRRDPKFDAVFQATPNVVLQMIVQLRDGPYVRVVTQYACKEHTPSIEKAAARSPSWALVEINHGPDPTNRVAVGAVR